MKDCKSNFIIFIVLELVVIFIVQFLFYNLQSIQTDSLSKSIAGYLQNEISLTDSYYVSRSIRNLEELKLVECSLIFSPKFHKRPYLDLTNKSKCNSNFWNLNGFKTSINLKANNGLVWNVSYKSINNSQFYFNLWLTRLLGSLILLSLFLCYNYFIHGKIILAKTQSKFAIDLNTINKQVAHDIRSPLSALDTAINDISSFPSDKRQIILRSVSRIHDIANDLLSKNRENINTTARTKSLNFEKILLSDLINSIASEKRVLCRNSKNIDINFETNSDNYGIFANLDEIEFSRALSNLLNNSIEALPIQEGKIEITFFKTDMEGDDLFTLKISDNGKGIPSTILKKLGTSGFSFEKETGSGLGIYHAKKLIDDLGGNFHIESSEGIGTEISITLPITKSPEIFPDSIEFSSNDYIIVLDDDQSVHEIWKERFKNHINLITFSNPDHLIAWNFPEDSKASLYLIDYEFLHRNTNGIEIIKSLNIAKKSVLVTSRYVDNHIQDSCKELGIKLLPKGLAGFVPIIKKDKTEKQATHVLLDDDELVRLSWESSAKNANIHLKTFERSDDLLQNLESLDHNTKFYVDSNLEEEILGEEVAKKIFDKGYKNIILATGYKKENFSHVSFVKDIIGKSAPWS